MGGRHATEELAADAAWLLHRQLHELPPTALVSTCDNMGGRKRRHKRQAMEALPAAADRADEAGAAERNASTGQPRQRQPAQRHDLYRGLDQPSPTEPAEQLAASAALSTAAAELGMETAQARMQSSSPMQRASGGWEQGCGISTSEEQLGRVLKPVLAPCVPLGKHGGNIRGYHRAGMLGWRVRQPIIVRRHPRITRSPAHEQSLMLSQAVSVYGCCTAVLRMLHACSGLARAGASSGLSCTCRANR